MRTYTKVVQSERAVEQGRGQRNKGNSKNNDQIRPIKIHMKWAKRESRLLIVLLSSVIQVKSEVLQGLESISIFSYFEMKLKNFIYKFSGKTIYGPFQKCTPRKSPKVLNIFLFSNCLTGKLKKLPLFHVCVHKNKKELREAEEHHYCLEEEGVPPWWSYHQVNNMQKKRAGDHKTF